MAALEKAGVTALEEIGDNYTVGDWSYLHRQRLGWLYGRRLL